MARTVSVDSLSSIVVPPAMLGLKSMRLTLTQVSSTRQEGLPGGCSRRSSHYDRDEVGSPRVFIRTVSCRAALASGSRAGLQHCGSASGVMWVPGAVSPALGLPLYCGGGFWAYAWFIALPSRKAAVNSAPSTPSGAAGTITCGVISPKNS